MTHPRLSRKTKWTVELSERRFSYWLGCCRTGRACQAEGRARSLLIKCGLSSRARPVPPAYRRPVQALGALFPDVRRLWSMVRQATRPCGPRSARKCPATESGDRAFVHVQHRRAGDICLRQRLNPFTGRTTRKISPNLRIKLFVVGDPGRIVRKSWIGDPFGSPKQFGRAFELGVGAARQQDCAFAGVTGIGRNDHRGSIAPPAGHFHAGLILLLRSAGLSFISASGPRRSRFITPGRNPSSRIDRLSQL